MLTRFPLVSDTLSNSLKQIVSRSTLSVTMHSLTLHCVFHRYGLIVALILNTRSGDHPEVRASDLILIPEVPRG